MFFNLATTKAGKSMLTKNGGQFVGRCISSHGNSVGALRMFYYAPSPPVDGGWQCEPASLVAQRGSGLWQECSLVKNCYVNQCCCYAKQRWLLKLEVAVVLTGSNFFKNL